MLKCLLSVYFLFYFSIDLYAQGQQDTLIYFIKNDGDVVKEKENADYILFIMPETLEGKKKIYPTLAFYPNGKRKMVATSAVKSLDFVFEGTKMMFFPNGKRSNVSMYEKGVQVGEEASYYPNGTPYAITKRDKGKVRLIECRDSTGNILAKNGEGKWLDFEEDFGAIKGQGDVKNGVRVGRWQNEKGNIVTIYKNGIRDEVLIYYPNGKLYTRELYNRPGYLRIECRDSLGNILASNGNGKWVLFDDDFKNVVGEGEVKKGIPTKWNKYEQNGILDEEDAKFLNIPLVEKFVWVDVQPEYPGGVKGFNNFLKKNVKYPSIDRKNNVLGRVLLSFIVEKDGSLTNIDAVSSNSKTQTEEALRVIKLSPKWTPGSIKGRSVRVQYNIFIDFDLGYGL